MADPGTAGGPAFALSCPELVGAGVRGRCEEPPGHGQPASKNALGAGAQGDLSDYRDLQICYRAVRQHCDTWDVALRSIVGAVNGVSDYGEYAGRGYFGALLQAAATLQKNPGDTGAHQNLAIIVQVLEKAAAACQSRATDAAARVKEFADNAAANGVALVGPDGNGGLLQEYDRKCSNQSARVAQITQELAEARDVLRAANDEYAQDVTVAATTPTYGWIWPFGTIAAGVVAGDYGKKATDALARAHATQAEIDQLAAAEAAAARTMAMLQLASGGATGIVRALQGALPAVTKVQGASAGIVADVRALKGSSTTTSRRPPRSSWTSPWTRPSPPGRTSRRPPTNFGTTST